LQWGGELLAQIVERIKNRLFRKLDQQVLLEIFSIEGGISVAVLWVWNLHQLLEKYDNELDHQFVLLVAVFHLETIGEMLHQDCDHFVVSDELLLISPHYFKHLMVILTLMVHPSGLPLIFRYLI